MKQNKILMVNDRKFFFKNQDLHTEFGFVRKEDIEKAKFGAKLKTNMGKEMVVMPASFIDLYRKIKRGAQIIPMKDIGSIITETGLNKTYKIVDAGSGSGGLCLFLAALVKKVYTYDIRDDHLEIVKKNIEFLGLRNVEAKKHDIYQSIPVKNIDLVTLDLPEPWFALNSVKKSLKIGGFLVSYSPCIPQVSDFVSELKKHKEFVYLRTIEILEREWEFDERKIRPKTQGIGHSGFLTFARKI